MTRKKSSATKSTKFTIKRLKFKTVHQIANPSDVDIHRAKTNASPAADTLNALVIFVHVIFELVHKALADSLSLCIPGIMTGAVKGKERIHAAVPVAHAGAGKSIGFILNIETPACRTNIGTGPSVDAGKCHIFPKRCFKKVCGAFIFQLIRGHPGGYLFLCGFFHVFNTII